MSKTAPLLESPATKDVALTPKVENQSLDLVQMFDRWVSDPNASVEKIERLMALWERNEARKAEIAFNLAMSAAQEEMGPVRADAENPQTRSRYASYEALDRALRPIYTKHGFALSFNTGKSDVPEHVLVLCDVTNGGHSKPYRLDMPADGKGAKGGDVMTKTHATGSALSYGMRYLLKMIFNIAVGEDDDDGNKAGAKKDESAPEGFDSWLIDMDTLVDGGCTLKQLMDTWEKSKDVYRKHMAKHRNLVRKCEHWKAKARQVKP